MNREPRENVVRFVIVGLVASSLAWLPGASGAAPPSATFHAEETGIAIEAGSMGRFVLYWPKPMLANGKPLAPLQKDVAADHATLHYAGGGAIDVAVDVAGTVTMSATSLPPDVVSLRPSMVIDFRFNQGGTFRAGDGPEQPFPVARPARPWLYQGKTDRLTIRSGDGRTLAFQFPQAGFAQVQDNREWNWAVYAWQFDIPYDARTRTYAVAITLGGEVHAHVLVDAFGQSATATTAARVQSVDALKADAASERQWLATLQPPARDAYGGLPGTGATLHLERTGFFHVEQSGTRPYLVDPAGNAFFQLGVCAMQAGDDYTFIGGRHDAYAWLPAPDDPVFRTAFREGDANVFSFYVANRIRKTGRPYDLDSFLAESIARCRAWGFNSAGAFSPVAQPAERRLRWPYAGILPPPAGAVSLPDVPGVWDPFDDGNQRRLAEAFEQRVRPLVSDTLLIGWFLANEPPYEKLATALPALPGKFAAKQRLVRFLADRYRTIDAFDRAWASHAASFEALADVGLDATTPAAHTDMHDFAGVFLDEYYGLVHRTFRAIDPTHLLLGSRLGPVTADDEQLCRVSGKYLDVLSINYYTYAIDPALTARVHEWSGRPLLFSEFFYSSPSDSRLPAGGPEVDSQEQRGLAYRQYVEQSAALGYVVGIEWFELHDMAATGRWFERYDGQDFNTGLIDVTDRPYRAMLDPVIRTNARIGDVLFGRAAPFVFDDPRFRVGAPGK